MKVQKTVHLQLITRDDCRQCKIVQKQLEAILPDFPNVEMDVFNLDRPNRNPPKKNTVITPAVWVDDDLWFLGKINPDRLKTRLDQLIGTKLQKSKGIES